MYLSASTGHRRCVSASFLGFSLARLCAWVRSSGPYSSQTSSSNGGGASVLQGVASTAARIGDAHANYGLIPGAGGSVRLARVVGTQMARLPGLYRRSPSPVVAGARGTDQRDRRPGELESRLSELAATLADKSPLGLRRMKRLINDAPDQSLADALAAEQQALRGQCRSEDFAEGIAAFAARRTRLPGPIGSIRGRGRNDRIRQISRPQHQIACRRSGSGHDQGFGHGCSRTQKHAHAQVTPVPWRCVRA